MKALLFALLLPGLSLVSTTYLYEYHYIGMLKTFWDARTYCREMFDDLATVLTQEDNDRLFSLLPEKEKNVWIGLYDDMNKWAWKQADMLDITFKNDRDFSNWVPGHPTRDNRPKTCIAMEPDGRWKSYDCHSTFPAVCYDEQDLFYFLLNTSMTWEDSKYYCFTYDNYTRLAHVRSLSENNNISSFLSTTTWIGLFKNHFKRWSNTKYRKFTNWDSNFASDMYSTETLCATINSTTATWRAFNCMQTFNFVCHKIYQKDKLRVKLKFETEADLRDPALQQQMLQQLHAGMEKQGMSDFKLRWVQTGGQAFHVEKTEKKQGSGACKNIPAD